MTNLIFLGIFIGGLVVVFASWTSLSMIRLRGPLNATPRLIRVPTRSAAAPRSAAQARGLLAFALLLPGFMLAATAARWSLAPGEALLFLGGVLACGAVFTYVLAAIERNRAEDDR